MQTIKYDTGIPLYLQLQNILKEQILRGEYQVNEQIPPENELVETYNVSRITVRNAIDKLVQEHLLYRLQGKGTFVAELKVKWNLPNLLSFSEEMKALGLVPSSRLVSKSVEEADETVQTLLQLSEKQLQVNRILRVRLANDEPIFLEDAFMPVYLCPDLLDKDVEKGSLYRMFKEDYHFSLQYAEENYEVTAMTPRAAELLHCQEHASAFLVERVTFLDTHIPISFTQSIGRGDKLRLNVKLVMDADTQFTRNVEL
jgi:GntR family transcriptional regulator